MLKIITLQLACVWFVLSIIFGVFLFGAYLVILLG